ncbi:glycoside hydrolase family 3 N-terminal domain-containing protein [Caulobacter endophyticus]|uniref:glycoside hydrolase family 3 N-terminal domain-containing protein n=1 Tax=Caulobacter endophyticus TaxID=2172652 RepID=UPI00240E9E8F|nr:glycoside hydrolase family 3 N-terminal domain-containing protein [Caulobacter endophyticus]MDG2531206.1 glycoside hydrolase family 3 N-terminal domain-containing protein [Caulobacter endophyticus]
MDRREASLEGISRRGLVAGAAGLAGLAVAGRSAAQARGSQRVEALIAQMTIDEKAGQLSCYADMIRPPVGDMNPAVNLRNTQQLLAETRAGKIGTLMNGVGVEGALLAQTAAVEHSRLGIPLLLAADVIHGFKTVYPIPLAEAASFDPPLAYRTARAAAQEATAHGLHWTFAPMVDVARDERWGRVAEGSGEDVFLGEALAQARVRGFQGPNLKAPDSMLSCAKHFAAYGAVAAGMDYNTVELSEATLREVHLPPFQAAFEAGCLTVMSAFNDINGVPATANKRLLTDLLRTEWGFRGVVISDYTADQELVAHGYAADDRDAARLAILAGVDISMQSGLYSRYLPELVKSGAVPMAVVDQAVRRVLMLKEAIGLFDQPFRSIDPKAQAARTATPAMRALSREAGAASIVLLKNDGNLLPLPRAGKRIALIGPFADDRDNILGPWAFFGDKSLGVDLATGFRQAMADPNLLQTVKGSDVEASIPGGIEAAVAAARVADIVVLAVGEGQNMSGEAQSRTDIGIPKPQMMLAEAVAAVGKPTVVLLRHGRALVLDGAVKNAPAILATWFLGTETGHAVADVVFGAVNPSGRLPVSFPYESGQQPYAYNHRTTGRPAPADSEIQEYKARWRTVKNEALYPFGYGLAYTTFALSNLKLSSPTLAWNGKLQVSARVTNTGRREGVHVVQLYTRDRVASRTRPVRELKRFLRVNLKPGEGRDITFELERGSLTFFGDGDRWTAEPGVFDVWVASSAVDGLNAQFTLLGA